MWCTVPGSFYGTETIHDQFVLSQVAAG